MTHVSIQKKRKDKKTKRRKKTKKQKTKTKQNKTNKQTNKQIKQNKKCMYFVIWPVIRTYDCRSEAYFWVRVRGDKGWFGGLHKIVDQQLANEWYLESLNF